MAKVTLEFDVPGITPTPEVEARIKNLLLHALGDMVTNNGHLIEASGDYSLAKLVSGRISWPMDGTREAEVKDLAEVALMVDDA